MTKGLEALHHPRIKSAKVDISAEEKHDIAYMFFGNTKQYAAIEQELKALEIIKSKSVNVFRLKFMLKQYGPFCGFYNAFVDTDNDDECLTQKEYDLLKEVLS